MRLLVPRIILLLTFLSVVRWSPALATSDDACTYRTGSVPRSIVAEAPSTLTSNTLIAQLLEQRSFVNISTLVKASPSACCKWCVEYQRPGGACVAAMYSISSESCFIRITTSVTATADDADGVAIPTDDDRVRADWVFIRGTSDGASRDDAETSSVSLPRVMLVCLVLMLLFVLLCRALAARRARYQEDGIYQELHNPAAGEPGNTSWAVASSSFLAHPATELNSTESLNRSATTAVDAAPRSISMGHPLFDSLYGMAFTRRFRLVSELGAGSYGKVYLVRPRHKASVSSSANGSSGCTLSAIKIIPCTSPRDITNAFHEYLQLKRVGVNPHVIELIDFALVVEEQPQFNGAQPSGPLARAVAIREQVGIGLVSLAVKPQQLSEPVFEAAASSVYCCIVTPYYEEGSLEAALRVEPEYFRRPSTVLSITVQVARGLAACHALGIAHNDVSLSNVLLADGKTRAVLADFGLARLLSCRRSDHPCCGSLLFMPPERVRGVGDLTGTDSFAADVWAVACIAVYLALAGRDLPPPRPVFRWREESDFADTFRDLLHVRCGLPESAVAVLLRMLAVQPKERPSIAECEALLTVAAPPRRTGVFFVP